MAIKFKVNASRRVADTVTKAFLSLHLAPKGYYLLTTIGRKSGIPRSNPVTLIEDGGHRWLVSPYGNVSWFYNVKASGKVTLTRNGKSETVAVRECSAVQAAPILRKYVIHVAITRPYFDVGVDSSEEAYVAEAPKHPVFEIIA
jgi:deazaflavin-dependent oxidoreductase (nitroreductase family)